MSSSTQVTKLKFCVIVKENCVIGKPEHDFIKKSGEQVDETIDQLCLSKGISNVSLVYISCQESRI